MEAAKSRFRIRMNLYMMASMVVAAVYIMFRGNSKVDDNLTKVNMQRHQEWIEREKERVKQEEEEEAKKNAAWPIILYEGRSI